MEEQTAKILNGEEFVPDGAETLVERYQRLSLVLRCEVERDDEELISLEMDELHDILEGVLA